MDTTTGQADITVRHFVNYLYRPVVPGLTGTREVDNRDPAREAREAPAGVYAFYYRDRVECTVTVESRAIVATSGPVNVTRRYFIRDHKLDMENTHAAHMDASRV
jgi:hypothetical protein